MRRVLAGTILGLLVFTTSPTAAAQSEGEQSRVIHPLVFQLLQNDVVLDPEANVAPASRIEFTRGVDQGSIINPDMGLNLLVGILGDVGIDIPGWVLDFVDGLGDFSNVDVSARLGPFLDADYGGYFQVQPSSRASFVLNNPVDIVNVVPAINSFKCGDEITIRTAPQYRSDASLLVRPSSYDFELGPVFKNIEFGVQAGVDVSVCVGLDIPVVGCAGYRADFHPPKQRIGMSVPLPSFLDPMPPLINVCSAAFRAGANESDLLGCAAGPITPLFNLWQHELDALNTVPGVHYTFAEFSPGQVRIFTPDLPTPLNFTLPEVEGLFKQPAPVNGAGATGDGRVVAAATQSDLAKASLDLVSLLEYAKIPTGLSLGGGLGAIDLGDIAPTFHIDQKMRYEFAPTMTMSMALGTAMPYRVLDPHTGMVVASGTGSTVALKPGQTVALSFPQGQRTPVSVTNTYAMTGTLNTQTSHQYRLSTQFKALKLSGPGFSFAALDEEIDLSGSILPEHPIENHTLALPAFTPVTAPGLTLDPQDPRITVTEHSVRDTLNLGGGERAVVYRTTVKNDGDVPLLNADLQLELARVFGPAQAFQTVCVASDGIAVNQQYDGTSTTNLLEPGTSLTVGQEGTVDVLVRVAPATARAKRNGCFAPVRYWSSSFAQASTAIGSVIRSDFDECTGKKTGWDLRTSVDLGASVIDSIDDFAIYASDSVVFDRASGVSRGNVGSGGTFQIKGARDGQMLQIIGDLHADRDLHVSQAKVSADYVQAHGDVKVDRKSSFAPTGAVSDCSDCNATFKLPYVRRPMTPWGSPRVTVPRASAVALDPGAYRLLQVRGGSTVTFRAGAYAIDDLVIAGDEVTLVFDTTDGPIKLTFDSWQAQKVDGLKLLVPSSNTRAVRINYLGHGELTLKNAVVQGTVIAPEARIRLEGTELYGAAYAERIEIGAGSTFHHHRYLAPLKIDATCVTKLQEAIKTPLVGQKP